MTAGQSSLWKTLLFPPGFALALYFLTTYVLLPLYRRYRARYPSSAYTLLTPITNRISSNFHIPTFFGVRRRDSAGSGDSLLGDEELEEGFGGGGGAGGRGDGREREERGEERLSLELERGFKDESESDEDDRRRGRGGRR
ncbi:MAG: hypothetical protein LQ338_004380 [Usnochroma carphineum]|nr:MAG: hypothetical protein LQ338_004380 [Usnochroma carphineum]